MKKLRSSLVLLFAMVIMSTAVFTSCDKDDASGAKATLMNEEWEMSTIETEDEIIKTTFEGLFLLFKTTYEFKKDDKYTVTTKFLLASDTEEGTWSISDDGKQITIDGATSEIIELTSKVFKMGPNTALMGEGSDYVLVFEAK
jgi:ABC-type oligopeptide transport system substrate-binding subunit